MSMNENDNTNGHNGPRMENSTGGLGTARLSAAKKVAGEMDEAFGGCPKCGRYHGMLNVERDHWCYCDTHMTRWCVGGNLFSGWRHENDAVWEQNKAKLLNYTEANFLSESEALESVLKPSELSGQDPVRLLESLAAHHPDASIVQIAEIARDQKNKVTKTELLEKYAGRPVVEFVQIDAYNNEEDLLCSDNKRTEHLSDANGDIRVLIKPSIDPKEIKDLLEQLAYFIGDHPDSFFLDNPPEVYQSDSDIPF